MNWAQLRGMLWLRWRLTRNQWRRTGQLNAAMTLVLMILALGLAVVGGFAGVVGGAVGLSRASPQASMFVWDGLVVLFLAFWTIGIVTELQRSEILDLSRLLFLPVSLRDVFLLNYLSSHLSLSLAMFLPVMLGLTVGLVLRSGVAMLLLFPLVFGFFFMVTAWTYCLRGWLASLMVNKRRRRAIVIGVTMALVLLVQLPNLVMNVWFGGRHAGPPQVVSTTEAPRAMRDRWPPRSIWRTGAYPCCGCPMAPRPWRKAARGRPFGAPSACSRSADGVWPRRIAPRSAFILAARPENSPRRRLPCRPSAPTERSWSNGEFRPFPKKPEPWHWPPSARCRAPEVKMALATNVLLFVFLGASMLVRRDVALPAAVQPFVAGAAVAVALMGLAQLMFNHFGFERGGFRAIVLLPTPRRHILLGKNLALLPVALTVFAIYLGLAALLAHLGMQDIVAGAVEFVAAFLVISVLGNLASILVPYRIAAGSLKPTKMNLTTTLLIFATHLLFPLAMAPVFLPAGLGLLCSRLDWLPAGPVTLACAILLAALSALVYWQTLEPLGRLLQRREQRILQVVTQEVE